LGEANEVFTVFMISVSPGLSPIEPPFTSFMLKAALITSAPSSFLSFLDVNSLLFSSHPSINLLLPEIEAVA